MHFNMKKAKFRRMSIISNSFDVRTSQRVRKPNQSEDDRKKDKQLLTPSIKRFLKTWLLDHKDYPYPDRYEKIMLAQETGLTIMQICNWFANWRRKLKLYSKDFKRRSYKAPEDNKTDSEEIEVDSDDARHHTTHSWTSQHQHTDPDWTSTPQLNPYAALSNYSNQQYLNVSHQQDYHRAHQHLNVTRQQEYHKECQHLNISHQQKDQKDNKEQVVKPRIWRPQEDLDMENKDLMLLKWLKSISSYDSVKYHPCYTKYAWDGERVKQILHEEDQYNYDRLKYDSPDDQRYDRLSEKTYELHIPDSPDHRYEVQRGMEQSGCDVHLDEVRQSDEILAAEILASFAQNRHASVC